MAALPIDKVKKNGAWLMAHQIEFATNKQEFDDGSHKKKKGQFANTKIKKKHTIGH